MPVCSWINLQLVFVTCVFVCLPAMQRKPVVTEVRTPTDTWSGLGFSKSMPAEAIMELRNISRRSYKPYLSNTNQTPVEQNTHTQTQALIQAT